MTFLVLGGTAQSRELAVRLELAGIPVICALLGGDPAHLPSVPVEVIAEGFGGVQEMADFLTARRVRAVVDASHPFATDVTTEAFAATRLAGVPMARLLPSSWRAQGGAPGWRWVGDNREACLVADRLGADRPFLSLRRDDLADFTAWHDRFVLARVDELPPWPLPPRWEVIRAVEPLTYAAEFALLSSRRIGVMVTGDTGGPLEAPKLQVAADLGIFVVMIRRPALPAHLRLLQTVDAAYDWVARRWRPQDY